MDDQEFSNIFAMPTDMAAASAGLATEDNPDDAARVMSLEDTTGVPAKTISADLPGFERIAKAAAASYVVRNNRYIQDYVNADPIHAQVSSDDWSTLAKLSNTIQQYNMFAIAGGNFTEGFAKGWGDEPWGQWAYEDQNLLEPESGTKRLLRGALITAGAPFAGMAFEALGRGIKGIVEGVHQSVSNLGQSAGMDEQVANRMANAFAGAAEMELTGTGVGIPHAPGEVGAKMPWRQATGFDKALTFLRNKEEPPPGVSPVVDKLRADAAKEGVDKLEDIEKELGQSTTADRSERAMLAFLQVHPDSNVQVTAEGIDRIYKGDRPEPGDNILGNVMGDTDLTVGAGTSVYIPLSDWLTKVPSIVRKNLKDDIIVQEGGTSINRAKEPEPPEEEVPPMEVWHGSPAKFEQFDINKMGEGEGAQVRGPGIYVAESKEVGEEYRKNISLRKFIDKVKDITSEHDDPAEAREAIDKEPSFTPVERELIDAVREDDDLGFDYPHQGISAAVSEPWNYPDLSPRTLAAINDFSHLYRAEVHRRPEEFIDADKGMNEQTPEIKAAFKRFQENLAKEQGGTIRPQSSMMEDVDWETFWKQAKYDFDDFTLTRVAHESGLAGIRFLDQRSREPKDLQLIQSRLEESKRGLEKATAEGNVGEATYHQQNIDVWQKRLDRPLTSNFVLFSDKDIRILDRNGEALQAAKDAYGMNPLPLEEAPEPGVPEGHVRLYRGETAGAADAPVPDWVREGPDFKATVEATGRWFTKDRAEAEHYAKVHGAGDKVSYVDIPAEDTEKYLSANQPEAKAFSAAGRESQEYFVSKEIAARRKPAEAEPQPPPPPPDPNALIRKVYTKEEFARYQEKVAKQRQDEADFLNRIRERNIRKRQTKEWKDKAAEITDDVDAELDSRPEIAADKLLREGVLNGVKLENRPRINPDFLTAEQVKGVPPEFVSKIRGMDPDTIAGWAGYPSGDAMIEGLIEAQEVRRQSGDGPAAWRSKIRQAEIDARLEKEFGPEENLNEIRDYFISQPQVDFLHDELRLMAEQAGLDPPLLQGKSIKEWVQQKFNDSLALGHSSKRYLEAAGRKAKMISRELLRDDPVTAFKLAQSRVIAVEMAKQAAVLEKAQAKLARMGKQYGSLRKDDLRLTSDHRNYIQWIYQKMGFATGWTEEGLANEIGKSEHPTFQDFVEARQEVNNKLDPAGWIGETPKIDGSKLTVGQVKELAASISDLIADGRGVNEIETISGKEEKATVMEQLQDQFEKFQIRQAAGETTKRRERSKFFRTQSARLISLESLWDRIDQTDILGPFNRTFTYMFARASGEYLDLDRTFSKMYNDNNKKYATNLNKKIENNFWINPQTKDPIKVTKGIVRAMLQYAGEATAWEKFTRGWKVDPDAAMQWLIKHSDVDDWKWAQGQGDIFAEIKKIDDKKRRDAGYTPVENLILKDQNVHGQDFKGWYQPMIYHEHFTEPVPLKEGGKVPSMTPEAKASKKALFGNDYVRAGMNRRWDNKRSAYARPTSLDLVDTAPHMSKMIRDIAYRDAVEQGSKFFYDTKFRAEMTKRFGEQYTDLLEPYLKTITNQDNYTTKNAAVADRFLDAARSSLMAHEVGYKLSTFLKHSISLLVNSITEVGGLAYLRELKNLVAKGDSFGDSVWKFAWESSPEIRRRMTAHYKETMGGVSESSIGKKNWRDVAIDMSGKHLSLFDTLSSIPQWTASYRDAMEKLEDEKHLKPYQYHDIAVDIADRAVRKAHGSTAITAKPEAIARASSLGRWWTSFYGVYGHFMQRTFEMSWKTADGLGLPFAGKLKEAESDWSRVSNLAFSVVLVPTAIEMIVSGQAGQALAPQSPYAKKDEGHSLPYVGLEALGQHFAGMLPFVRDAVRFGMQGGSADGLFGTEYKAVMQPLRDVGAAAKGKGPTAFKALLDVMTALGAATGVIPDQAIKIGKLLKAYSEGKEKPKGINPFTPGTWGYGIIHGTIKPPPNH
jgi:hypothetical protein